MQLDDFIWLTDIVDKIKRKHQVEPYEVETLDELVAFWDTHDFTDYLDEMEEVDLDRFTQSHTGVAPYPFGRGLDAAIEGDRSRAGPIFW